MVRVSGYDKAADGASVLRWRRSRWRSPGRWRRRRRRRSAAALADRLAAGGDAGDASASTRSTTSCWSSSSLITLLRARRCCSTSWCASTHRAQPGAVAHHAQHGDRGAVDGGAGADPGHHRDPVLQADVLHGPDARTPNMTIKVTGHQWYWSYEYPDQTAISTSTATCSPTTGPEAGPAAPARRRQPAGRAGRHQRSACWSTGTDVIHSWFVPSFGVQEYAVIGRAQRSWINVDKRRHLLRPVQPDLRRQPRLHADRGRGGVEGRFPEMAGRRARRNSPPTSRARGATQPCSRRRRAGACRQPKAKGSLMAS